MPRKFSAGPRPNYKLTKISAAHKSLMWSHSKRTNGNVCEWILICDWTIEQLGVRVIEFNESVAFESTEGNVSGIYKEAIIELDY